MGRQKDGPKQKSKVIPNLFCTIARPFFHFFPELHFFGAFTGHDGFLYLRYASFSLRCIPEREWAKAEEEERTAKSWRNDEKYTLLYTPSILCFVYHLRDNITAVCMQLQQPLVSFDCSRVCSKE
jgi:hypothetical protein